MLCVILRTALAAVNGVFVLLGLSVGASLVSFDGVSIGEPHFEKHGPLIFRLTSRHERCLCLLPGSTHRVDVATDGAWHEVLSTRFDDAVPVDSGRFSVTSKPGAPFTVSYRSTRAASVDGIDWESLR